MTVPPGDDIPKPELSETPAQTVEPTSPRSGMDIPRTTYIWAFILVVSLLLPRFLSLTPAAKAGAKKENAALTSSDFQKIIGAETTMRGAFGAEALAGPLAGAAKPQALQEAIKQFRSLAQNSKGVNSARRVVILEHEIASPTSSSAKKPSQKQSQKTETKTENDTSRYLETTLRNNLKEAGRTDADITAELRLWHSLYDTKTPTPLTREESDAAVTRVREMKIPFLENLVVSQIYQAAGREPEAKAARTAFEERARKHSLNMLAYLGYTVLAFGTGIITLIYLAVATGLNDFRKISVPSAHQQPLPRRLGWGDLMDVFVFYMMVFFTVSRFLASFFVERFLPEPSIGKIIVLLTVVTVVTGVISLLYLRFVARRRSTTLADIGWTTGQGLFKDIGIGFLGFCTTLPCTILLGMASRLIFGKDNPNLTPNPALTLLISERDFMGRFLIFLLVAFAAPLFEEFFFRGVLFSGLRARFGRWPAILLSAVVFASLHPMTDWLPILGLGITFGILRESRQSLVPSMTAHFLQNSQSFLSLIFLAGP